MVLMYDAETANRLRQKLNAPAGTELAPRFRESLQAEIDSERAANSEINRMKRYMGRRPSNIIQYHWWLVR